MLLLPSAADGQGTAITHALTSASTLCQVEPVGRWFEAFVKRRNRNASASFQELEDKKELSEESEDEELQLEEFPMLKTLDPKDWKNQDHYAVLGLGHVRYKATQRQIKAARECSALHSREWILRSEEVRCGHMGKELGSQGQSRGESI
uniref:DnaJ heat shock protein family (Hsp40) member C2 n=1 Tax=Felis catus TaxID=9685 RepID=A0ABI7XUX6_FELCA